MTAVATLVVAATPCQAAQGVEQLSMPSFTPHRWGPVPGVSGRHLRRGVPRRRAARRAPRLLRPAADVPRADVPRDLRGPQHQYTAVLPAGSAAAAAPPRVVGRAGLRVPGSVVVSLVWPLVGGVCVNRFATGSTPIFS